MERKKFTDMGLSEPIMKAIEDLGFEEATPIQTAAIPVIMDGRDVTGHSKTGTGKTIAFGIPALQMIDADDKRPQVLVLCPTRELAIQAAGEIRKLIKYIEGIKVVPIYGGQPIDRQIKALKQGVQIIIGTPGRVMDHMKRKTLKFDDLKMLVLDEADEMLNMGFREDIEKILTQVPEQRQTLLFSATMPREIMDITYYYQYDPEYIQIVHNALTVPEVDQFYLEVAYGRKAEVAARLIEIENPKQTLVFCNTKRMVDDLVAEFIHMGLPAEGIHGGMRQTVRTRVMKSFRAGTLAIMVATDVAARGIDIDNIEVIINYDVPQDEELYVHRIGRTARAGRKGRSFTFVSDYRELRDLDEIKNYINADITMMKTPEVEEAPKRLDVSLVEKIQHIIGEGSHAKYLDAIEGLVEHDYKPREIAAALASVILDKGKTSSGSTGIRHNFTEKDFENTGGESGMVRFFINAGKDQGIRPGDIVGAIAGESNIHGSMIGAIKIQDKNTFVDIPFECAMDVLNAMYNSKIKGKKIKLTPAKASQKTAAEPKKKHNKGNYKKRPKK